MRILLIILTLLTALAAAGMGILASSNGFGEEAEKAEKMVTDLEAQVGKDSPLVKETRAIVDGYKISSIGGLVIAGLSILALLVGFTRQKKLALFIMLALIAAAVAFILMSPALDTGDKANPQMQAMMFGIPGILAGLFSFGATKLAKK